MRPEVGDLVIDKSICTDGERRRFLVVIKVTDDNLIAWGHWWSDRTHWKRLQFPDAEELMNRGLWEVAQ